VDDDQYFAAAKTAISETLLSALPKIMFTL
jgi:hypothetical protein